jgi:tetratricopeptide (TPR) repeat protein
LLEPVSADSGDEGVTPGPEWENHGDMDDRLKQQLVLGREHYQKREFDKAEPLLQAVVDAEDGFADVHNMLGVIAHERSDFKTAEKHLERATELNPNYTEALLNLAVTYNDQSKYEAGRQVYRRIRSARDRSTDNLDPFVKGKIANMHAELAQAYEDAGLRSDAIRELERAVSMCPTFADLQTRLGTLHRDSGDLTKAKEHYEAARNANPRYPLARLMLGVTLLALNDVQSAKVEWRAVLEHDPGNKSASMYLRMAENMPPPTVPPPPSSQPPEP